MVLQSDAVYSYPVLSYLQLVPSEESPLLQTLPHVLQTHRVCVSTTPFLGWVTSFVVRVPLLHTFIP